MPYKLNPDHTYIVVFLFFLFGASVKFLVEQVHGSECLDPAVGLDVAATASDGPQQPVSNLRAGV